MVFPGLTSHKGNTDVVYHVTIVAIGRGLLKKFWPFVTRLRYTHCREFNYLKLCRPAYFMLMIALVVDIRSYLIDCVVALQYIKYVKSAKEIYLVNIMHWTFFFIH